MSRTTVAYLALACSFALLTGCGDDGQTLDDVASSNPAAVGRPGSIQFAATTFQVNESAGNASVTLTRVDGTDGAVSVSITSRNGTALTTQPDYTAVNATITFAAGDAALKTVTVPITNDAVDESDETLFLTIISPTGGAAIGTPKEAMLTIVDDDVSAPAAPSAIIATGYRNLRIDWTAAADATSYRVMKDARGSGTFAQVGAALPGTQRSIDIPVIVHKEEWPTARYRIDACNAAGCTGSSALSIAAASAAAIGYLKAPAPAADSFFGGAIALSADGNTLAVGAQYEDGTASGVGGTPNTLGLDVGAVFVFTRTASGWSQPVYIKASNPGNFDYFGNAVALSADGNVLAVGAPYEDSSVGGAVPDELALSSGAVYVYVRSGATWTGPTYIKASNVGANHNFGFAVSLNSNGSLLAVGAPWESTGAALSGAAYVFTRNASNWSESAYLKASNIGASDQFGNDLALSADGTTLVVGAPNEASGTTGIGSTPDETAPSAGAAYLFTNNAGAWSTPVYLKASNTGANDDFGSVVAISDDGSVVAVGAPAEDSGTTGVGSTPDEAQSRAGAVYVFTRTAGTLSGPTYIKGIFTGSQDEFGYQVALSGDGTLLAVGAIYEDSLAAGVISTPDETAGDAGIVFTYVRAGSAWTAGHAIKASNPDVFDNFGEAIALSADGNTLAVGSAGEDSAAGGFNGNQQDQCNAVTPANCAAESGAVYIY